MFCKIAIYLTVFVYFVSADFEETVRDFNPQIIGGSNVDIKRIPYIVSIRWKSGRHFCGGSIYSARIIITAAHCMIDKNLEDIEIIAGSTSLTEERVSRTVLKAFVHPNYEAKSFDYDVAVVLLDHSYIFNFFIRPIDLATERPREGKIVLVSGWGYKQEKADNADILQETHVRIMNQELCNYEYKGLITRRMICAGLEEGGQDACTNDSGGPMVYENALLGIISFGYGCGYPGYPGVYTSVPNVLVWINSIVNNIGYY